MGDEPVFII
ncbi:hypothetical protein VCHC57A1_1470, partial [Vibrio cholerae HC-57A1]